MKIPSVPAVALVLLAVGAPVANSADPVPAASAAARPPSAARGRKLYMTVGCVHCHGSEGQGSTAGAKLAPDPLSAEAIAAFIRTPNTQMPAYSAAVLGDADVADIAAFLRSLRPPKAADDIPALRALKAAP
ncbi:MAG: cytochrome c [Steroidobacteraceae bacterium]|jgi:mono/diheme cytochrome c family protein|nr:cytochrome c [Steroidobacteraceae bacterium]